MKKRPIEVEIVYNIMEIGPPFMIPGYKEDGTKKLYSFSQYLDKYGAFRMFSVYDFLDLSWIKVK